MSRRDLSSSAAALCNLPASPRSKSAAELSKAQRLSAEELAALSKAREARWRPGLEDQPLHSEIFASARDASGIGLAFALARDALRVSASRKDPLIEAQDRRSVLWVQESRAIQQGGRPYLYGLPCELRDRIMHVEAKSPQDALFALEEGLRCKDLACVIGEIVGNPRALDFTASRRLSLAAEKHETPLWLVRLEAQSDLSSARMRWRVEAAPSFAADWNSEAPGIARWKAELFRARRHAPGQWIMHDDQTTLYTERPESNCGQNPEIRLPCPKPKFARASRFWRPTGASNCQSAAPNSLHLVRATVGRSLAACARV